MLKERLQQIKESNDILPKLEDIYFGIAQDIGLANLEIKNNLSVIQNKKKELKEGKKSIAEFNREFELTAEYLAYKQHKYEIAGLETLSKGLYIKITSLRAEAKGTY